MASEYISDAVECPICSELMDETDQCFKPCKCGFQICGFCLKQIKETGNGKCPQCREPYNPENYTFEQPSEMLLNAMKKKQKQKKQVASDSRKHLANCRVIQRNLVYVTNVALDIAKEEILKKHEYFGQYGKVLKVVVNKSHIYQGTSVSCYVTYSKPEEAYLCIGTVDGCELNGKILKASFGTTKYCSFFIKGKACPNPDCMYLHHLGDENDRFTKEDMQSGKHLDKVPLPSPSPGSSSSRIGLPPPRNKIINNEAIESAPPQPVVVAEAVKRPTVNTHLVSTEPKKVWNIPEVQPISIQEELRKSTQKPIITEKPAPPKSLLPPNASWASKDKTTVSNLKDEESEESSSEEEEKDIEEVIPVVKEEVVDIEPVFKPVDKTVEKPVEKPVVKPVVKPLLDISLEDDIDVDGKEKPLQEDHVIEEEKFLNSIIPDKEENDLESLLSDFTLDSLDKGDTQDEDPMWDLSPPPGISPKPELMNFPNHGFDGQHLAPTFNNVAPQISTPVNNSNSFGLNNDEQHLNELRALMPGVNVRISSNPSSPIPKHYAQQAPQHSGFNSQFDQAPKFNDNMNQRLQIFRQLQTQQYPPQVQQPQMKMPLSSDNTGSDPYNPIAQKQYMQPLQHQHSMPLQSQQLQPRQQTQLQTHQQIQQLPSHQQGQSMQPQSQSIQSQGQSIQSQGQSMQSQGHSMQKMQQQPLQMHMQQTPYQSYQNVQNQKQYMLSQPISQQQQQQHHQQQQQQQVIPSMQQYQQNQQSQFQIQFQQKSQLQYQQQSNMQMQQLQILHHKQQHQLQIHQQSQQQYLQYQHLQKQQQLHQYQQMQMYQKSQHETHYSQLPQSHMNSWSENDTNNFPGWNQPKGPSGNISNSMPNNNINSSNMSSNISNKQELSSYAFL